MAEGDACDFRFRISGSDGHSIIGDACADD